MSDRQQDDIAEIEVHSNVIVVTANGEQQMTIKEMSELIQRSDDINNVLIRLDLH